MPTLEKQTVILEKLEFIMENSKRLESVYQTKINSLNELKQSLLQKAFSGELTADKAAAETALKEEEAA